VPSTYSLPNIFANVANKFLRAGFDNVDSAWRQITAIRSTNDFKTTTTISLNGATTFRKVAPGGEIKHGTLTELAYTNRAETYAIMLGIDRRDMVNDDLGALSRAGQIMGRGAAKKINDVFWTVFLNNSSSFFTSGNLNVSTGAGSALSSAGLKTADQKFRVQTDQEGLPLGAMPKILLVPPTLWYTARELMNATANVGNTTANTLLPNANIWQGAYTVVTSPYMENSAYTGNSAAAWYLLADPQDIPAIETVFLNGRDTPIVETAELDFDMLGVAMRGYLDFGVSLQEYRAGVRSAGS
jgi:phage major head subunit gpT-like protein